MSLLQHPTQKPLPHNCLFSIKDRCKFRPYLQFVSIFLTISSRDVPKPNLPYGGAHKLSNNYYVSRDTRGSALPPLKISSAQELIGANQER